MVGKFSPDAADRAEHALTVGRNEAVAILTLNNPANRNALSSAMMTALERQFERISRDANLRVVIIRATGPGFCAGHDLKEIQAHRKDADGGKAFFTGLFDQCTGLMARIRALPQPVIAAVHGTAVAAGCQLVATADLAVAGDAAGFGVNGINAGFFCSTPGVALSRNIGRKATMELLLTGRLMTAGEALKAGLVNRVVATRELDANTMELAQLIAAKSGPVVRFGKKVFHQQIEATTDEAYGVASPAMTENLLMEDCDEGISAFIEKRLPDWNRN